MKKRGDEIRCVLEMGRTWVRQEKRMALKYGELVKTIWSKGIASLIARDCPTSKTWLNLVFKTL